MKAMNMSEVLTPTCPNRWRSRGMSALVASLFFIPVIVRSPFYLHILIILALNIVMAMALRLPLLTGRFNIGIVAFSAIGAYTSALLAVKLGIGFWLASVAGATVAGLVALCIGYIILRVSGVYFAILTMCLLEMLRHFLLWYRELTNGAIGVISIPGPSIFGFDFGVNRVPYYYLTLTFLLFSIWLLYRIERSRIGIAFRAIGQSDLLSEHLGINLTRYRVLAFSISGIFAAFAGSISAHYLHYTSPEDFTIMQSMAIQIFMVVGGRGSPMGPLVGTIVLTGIGEALRPMKEILPLVYGGILVFVILFYPQGLIGLPLAISKWAKCFKGNLPPSSR